MKRVQDISLVLCVPAAPLSRWLPRFEGDLLLVGREGNLVEVGGSGSSRSSAWVIQSRYPLRSSSICWRSRCFWKSPRDFAFSLSLENSLQIVRVSKASSLKVVWDDTKHPNSAFFAKTKSEYNLVIDSWCNELNMFAAGFSLPLQTGDWNRVN